MAIALCPRCGGDGCEKCSQKGHVELTIDLTQGLVDMTCEACGMNNGGGVAKFYDPSTFKGAPNEVRQKCVFCDETAVTLVHYALSPKQRQNLENALNDLPSEKRKEND